MEEKQTVHNTQENIWYLICAVASVAAMAFVAFWYKKDTNTMIADCVMISLTAFLLFFAAKQEAIYDRFVKRNVKSAKYFSIAFLVSLIVAIIAPVLPVAVWPFMTLFVMLSLFGNSIIGILGGGICLMISVNAFAQVDSSVFLMYLFSGIAAVIFFRNINEEYHIAIPIFLSEVFQGLCIAFYSGYTVTFDTSILLFAFVNLVFSFLLLLVVLKCFSSLVVHRERNKYLDLSDPENELLAKLKKESVDDYFKAVHVAYFCERICARLEIDSKACKTAAYYHNIGKLVGDSNWNNTLQIANENQFPTAVVSVLHEFLDEKSAVKQLDTVILYLSESVISSVLYLIRQKKDMKIDYDKLVGMIFEQKMKDGSLKFANVTMHQLDTIKKIFVEEKLYYDFLR